MNEPELIEGIDPMTRKRARRFDGQVTEAVPIRRTEAVHPASDPQSSQLVEARRSSDLVIASDLGVGLSQLVEDDRLQSQAAVIRRELDERFGYGR